MIKGKEYFIYVGVSVATMSFCLYATRNVESFHSVRVLLMYILFMIGHYLYIRIPISKIKKLKRHGKKERSTDNIHSFYPTK